MFSDENKFNLDSPDGYILVLLSQFRNYERIILRRKMGVGSVMFWCAIGYKGRSQVVFLDGLMYRDLLTNRKSRFRQISGRHFIIQHDNVPIYTARIIKLWLETNSILILD